ncbi:MAG: ImmA/IrrE family metallo-endopeptidase [Clostridiales bacterium]|nr:ImmA/IrrE family metallo-endopeptidase [Clostridiales bacterium]
MTKNKKLEEVIAQKRIKLFEFSCPKSGSLSIETATGDCYVAIDTNLTPEQELVCTAHEVGHCVLGAFYNRHSPFNVVSKLESRANHWAINALIPENELVKAFERAITEIWELAEFFGVTENFMIQVCIYYGYYHKA